MLGLSEPPEFPVLEPEALAFPPEGLSAGLPMVSVGTHVAGELVEDAGARIALQGLVAVLDGVLGLVLLCESA